MQNNRALICGDKIFYWGLYPRGPGDLPVGSNGETPVTALGDEVTQKLKQFGDIVYIYWLQKQSQFENFTQFTSWFLTSVFHGWARLSPLWAPSPPWVSSPPHGPLRFCVVLYAPRPVYMAFHHHRDPFTFMPPIRGVVRRWSAPAPAQGPCWETRIFSE